MASLRVLSILAAFSFLAGCGDGSSTTGTIPEQLEAIEVAVAAENGQAMTALGALSITGSDRAYTVSVASGDAMFDFELHSPGRSPLAELNGLSANVELTAPMMGGRSVVISDDVGPLYVAALGDNMGLEAVEKALGKGVVRRGEQVGTQTDGTFVWRYTKAVFKTDDGDVALLPGEVRTVKINGSSWRAVATVAYEVGTNPDAEDLPGCSPESMLGFELFRTSTPEVEEPAIRRLAGKDVAYVGCTAPGGE